MKFRLDHVIIAVHDLAAAIADYRALGFTVHPGGRHSKSTSHNALVVFEDGAYFEIISWPQPDAAHRWYGVLGRHGEGLMDFALIPDDVPRAIDEAKSRGLALNGPIDGGRVRTDGMELKWQTGRQATFDLPFLCGDITPREGRVPTGDLRRHGNGARGVATVSVAVADLEASMARYAALLGEKIDAPLTLPGLGVRAAFVRLENTVIALVTPSVDAQPCPFVRDLKDRLESRGEGPCAVAIRAGASALLDPRYTHGVVAELAA